MSSDPSINLEVSEVTLFFDNKFMMLFSPHSSLTVLSLLQVPNKNTFQKSAVGDNTLGLGLPLNGVVGSSFPMVCIFSSFL